jgi:hypothetical protein
MSTLIVNTIGNSSSIGSPNRVYYRNSENIISGSDNLTFDGTNLNVSNLVAGGYPVLNNYSISYGVYNGTTNYVYPPEGKTINKLIGFIPSINQIYFSGRVNGDDSLYCYYTVQPQYNRIEVICYNSEQRSTPYFSWMAIWSV